VGFYVSEMFLNNASTNVPSSNARSKALVDVINGRIEFSKAEIVVDSVNWLSSRSSATATVPRRLCFPAIAFERAHLLRLLKEFLLHMIALRLAGGVELVCRRGYAAIHTIITCAQPPACLEAD
jgi:hypothetical protein